MSSPVKISDSEWEVMNVVWGKAPVPASEVVEQLGMVAGVLAVIMSEGEDEEDVGDEPP